MPRWPVEDEEWDEDDEPELDEDEDEPTLPCPYCRREIHEDAQRCPYCESYISREDARPSRKPWWLVLGVFACLYVVYRWIVPW
jgi:hypothetical protein